MADKRRIDSIYLNKRNDDLTNNWAYYRITSIGGADGDPIEGCLVKWPTMEDLDSVSDESTASVWTPGITGLAKAYPTIEEFLKKKWAIDHSASTLIGLILRDF